MEVVGEKEVSFSRWRQLVWTLMNVVMSDVTLEPRTSHAPVVSVYQRLKNAECSYTVSQKMHQL